MNRYHVLPLVAAACFFSSFASGIEQSPTLPDAVIDLRVKSGLDAVSGQWHYTDVHITEVPANVALSGGAAGSADAKTHTIHPLAGTSAFEAADWQPVDPDALEARRTAGRLAFGWYRLRFTVPDKVGSLAAGGATIVLEATVDDYAEIWVNGRLQQVVGQSGGAVVAGWNAPNRLTICQNAKPGQRFDLAIFAANGPLSNPPANHVWIRSATLDFYKAGHSPTGMPMPVETRVSRLHPELDQIIAVGAVAEKLADGFAFTEGPVWVPELASEKTYGGGGTGGYLLFSDPNRNVIHRWDPMSGAVSVFRTKSGYAGVGGADMGEYHQPGSNGLALSPGADSARLTICEHGNRRITRLEPNGSITVLADRFEGKRLNSPNDLVYRSDGTLFFTDPPFGLPRTFDDALKELDSSAVFCVYNGVLRPLVTDLKGPNGLAFSPDESHLYVGNWDVERKVIMRYAVGPDGGLSNPEVFADLSASPGEICLDGLKVDARGNVFASAPGGIWVYTPAGVHLGTIGLPEQPANFAFGDPDKRTLYITARTGLYRIRLK